MGLVFKQSFRNTIIIYLSFVVGGLNTIFFYPTYLKEEYYGIITLLYSYCNVIMPLMAFGMQYTIVKFFSSYNQKEEKDKFLTWVLIFPLVISLPIAFAWSIIQELIISSLTPENRKLENYTMTIYIFAICCAYFEVFYAWAKVHLQTVFGNILKEFWNRAATFICLFLVYFEIITDSQFIYLMVVSYIIRTLVMLYYAFRIYTPKLRLQLPKNYKAVLKYSAYIILAGSAGAMLIDIDKLMIPSKETFAVAAYYTVAVFIGSFIEAPGRAMSQILQPLTSQSLNDNNTKEVLSLYQKSSINLLLVGGLFFLLVNCGVTELFRLMPKGYAGGEMVVLIISLAKLFTMSLGSNFAIIQNAKFYRIALPIGLGSALGVYFLNKYFYFDLEIGTMGLALSTLIVIGFFNVFKVLFVYRKTGMQPYTWKSLKITLIICFIFASFYFWNFKTPDFYLLNLPIHPIVNIILKSILILSLYLFISIKMNISDQFTNLIMRLMNKFI